MEKTKVYTLLYTEDSDDRCGSEVEVFTDEQAARAEMQRQYAQTLNNLYHEPDDGDDAPALDERNARISMDGCFNCYSWEITVHEIEVPQDVYKRQRKNLPLSEINRVSNLASTHRSCHKLVHGQKSKDGFSPKAVRQAEKYRKKLLS